jgi:ABC-type glycerol-3-phosphate transport system permease component
MKALVYLLLLAISAVMLFPFFYMFTTSLKDEVQLAQPRLLPTGQWHWENFGIAWTREPFTRYLLNSSGVAAATVLLTLWLASMAGFALAKYRFRGKNLIFLAILATLMVPGQVTMIPNFLTCSRLQLLDSYAGLVIPVLPLAFGIFLLRQFMGSVPDDLIEAAKIDGAGDLRIYGQLMLPLCTPALLTLSIFTFMGSWNNFMWPLIVLDSPGKYTLPIGLLRFAQQYSVEYNYLMAVSLVSILPIVILFSLFQRWFVKGIAMTGLKE